VKVDGKSGPRNKANAFSFQSRHCPAKEKITLISDKILRLIMARLCNNVNALYLQKDFYKIYITFKNVPSFSAANVEREESKRNIFTNTTTNRDPVTNILKEMYST